MALCGNASLWAIIAFVVILIALVLDIAGFATISWMVYQITTNSIKVGLWKMKSCVARACTESSVSSELKNGKLTVSLKYYLTCRTNNELLSDVNETSKNLIRAFLY